MAKRKWRKYTEDDKRKIEELYVAGKNTYEIAALLDFPKTSITGILHRKGLVRSKREAKTKYSVNHDFFSKIETPIQAYVLGFIFADGCNITSYRRLTIQLASKDTDQLILIKDALQYTGGIQYRTTKLGEKYFQASTLNVKSGKISNDLLVKGCGANKSLTLEWPNDKIVPENLKWHFIRGYFDGDGHISRGNTSQCYLCVSNHFGIGLLNFLKENGINGRIVETKSKILRLLITKKIDSSKFLLRLYENSDNIRLSRKYDIFLKRQQSQQLQ